MRLSRTSRGAVLLARPVAALTVGFTESSQEASADSVGPTTAGSDARTSSVAAVTTMTAPQGAPIVIAMIFQESGPAGLPGSRLAATGGALRP